MASTITGDLLVQQISDLLNAAGTTNPAGRITEDGLRAMEALLARLSVSNASGEQHRTAFQVLMHRPDATQHLRRVRLDKYLRGSVVGDAARALQLVALFVRHLIATPAGSNFEAYVVHANHQKRAEAIKRIRELSDAALDDGSIMLKDEFDPPASGVGAGSGASEAPTSASVVASAPASASAGGASVDWSKPLVLWVDDRPKNNEREVAVARAAGVCVVQVLSTAQALDFLSEHSRRLGMLGPGQFRIVSDRSRVEERESGTREEDHDAVFKLWDAVRLEHYLMDTPMLIYTSAYGVSEVTTKIFPKMAAKNVADRNLQVTAAPEVCVPFVTMTPIIPS